MDFKTVDLFAMGVALAITIWLIAPASAFADEIDFDPNQVERIVPGTTAREDVRDWFGAPDHIIQLENGTSRWVYVKTRVVDGETMGGDSNAVSKENKRAENARRFAKNSKALAREGKQQLGNFLEWIDRKFRFPPRPLYREREDLRSPSPAVSSPPLSDEPNVEGDASEFQDAASSMDAALNLSNVVRMELSIAFARDGAVDKFEYQRTMVPRRDG